MQEAPPWKKSLISSLIVLWLAFQIIFPLTRKIILPSLKYQYATFSWAMYSKPAIRYEVSLFRQNPGGNREAIHDIKTFVREYASPGPLQLYEYFRTRKQIQDWNTRLINTLAAAKTDGAVYGVSIEWKTKFDPSEASHWEYKTTARKVL